MPRTCICVVIGLEPMKGRRKPESDMRPVGLSVAFTTRCLPVAVTAGMLVIVEACPDAGRADGFALGAEKRLKKSPKKDDLGFTACALAITPLLGTDFEETLLAHERGQVELQPPCTA